MTGSKPVSVEDARESRRRTGERVAYAKRLALGATIGSSVPVVALGEWWLIPAIPLAALFSVLCYALVIAIAAGNKSPLRTDGGKRMHFVEGDLRDELDRLGVTRTARCVSCGQPTSDDEVGHLENNEPEYDTFCVDCSGEVA